MTPPRNTLRSAWNGVLKAPATLLAGIAFGSTALASSHQDAPLISLDDAANTTDVYAFKSMENGVPYLTTAVAVYPFENPGIGPNKHNFDDNVLYSIFVATGDNVAAGMPTYRYDFYFRSSLRNDDTILQSYLGVVENTGDSSQNLLQSYYVLGTDFKTGRRSYLGRGMVPPNNQGIATPHYNINEDGNLPAKPGVSTSAELDQYTSETIASLRGGFHSFAGQREDGFYGDIQSIFDLLQLRSGGVENSFDSQSGFNVHTIALNIPLSAIGGESQVVGVWATTSRRQISILDDGSTSKGLRGLGKFVQVGRQGNPLFCEAIVAMQDKDLYNRTQPSADADLFKDYALNPELAALINALVTPVPVQTDRTDLAGIFIPDVIKVDLSTVPARLPGGDGDDEGYHRLSIFGSDVLISSVQDGFTGVGQGVIPGGWPNGRRFGDDVIDIAVIAILSDLRDPAAPVLPAPLADLAGLNLDNVASNDSVYNKVFPYAATPHNGRNFTANPNLVRPSAPVAE
ncbi:MAG: DUF4331 domain-containing protein [Verrucomicrobiales bacterium]